jgi:hypothetical protein
MIIISPVPDGTGIPAFFLALSAPRRLLALAAVTLVSGAAMLPAMKTMSDHGHSVVAFEGAGSVERSAEILDDWGEAGKRAAWWQLAFDMPFLIGYGLFAAGACAAVARRASKHRRRDENVPISKEIVPSARARLVWAAGVVVWFGVLAAAADFAQNVSLAFILSGHVAQPWPLISALALPAIQVLEGVALLFALAGWLATGGLRGLRPRAST